MELAEQHPPVDARRVAKAKQHGLNPDDAGRLAGLLTLLGDPVRVRILYALELVKELCVGDVALALDITEDAASYGLRMLRMSGLVQTRKDGRTVHYRLAESFPEPLLEHCLLELLHLSRLAHRADSRATDDDRGGAAMIAMADPKPAVVRPEDVADHHGDHGHDHVDHVAQFRSRFWWNLLLAVPVVAFSPMFSDLLGYSLPHGTDWIDPVLGTVIFFWGGWPFLSGAVSEVRARQPGMMLLIGLAITVAFSASLATSLGIGDLDLNFWWELALLVVIMLLGHWLEMKAIGQARGALESLAELLPDEAERLGADGHVEVVPLHALGAGDLVLVRPGGRVPADGTIVDGEAELDESMVSGESRPVPKGVGDTVVAGTISTDSALRMRVLAVGEDTALAGIQRLVLEAQSSHSRAQALADRAAALLFYVAAGAGVVTFVVWLAIGNADDAVERTVTVLVIACPHALGLAIPLVIALATAISARAGILVKDRLALERMREVDAVLFDKTGTLTTARHALVDLAIVAEQVPSPDDLLAVAAAVESDSEHPLARAIVAAAVARGAVPPARDFHARAGRGVEAVVGGRNVAVGGPGLLRERSLSEPDDLLMRTHPWRQRGASVLYVVRDNAVVGALALEDEVRPESRAAIDALHGAGVKVVMITGDAKEVADAVGRDLGIDEVFAEVLPEDKDKAVTELQGRGLRVAMVGDGVNDAPALARADVGIAIGAGTDVAIESAGVVLVSSDPRAVLSVIKLSRATYAKMVQNLAWGAGYNVFAIPLAAGVFAWAGFTLAPAVGAVLMSLSTIVVALNAQLLRRVDLRPRIGGTICPVTVDHKSQPLLREIIVLLGVMAVAGSLIAVQARINGELAVKLGSSLGAATVNFGLGLAVISAIALTKRRDGLRRLVTTRTRWWFWLGGLGGAASAWSLAAAIPKIGVSLGSVGLAAGMTSGGLFADRVGLGVFGRHRVTLARLAGAALAVAAVTVSASSGLSSANQIQFVVFVVIGGFATACQQPINGTLAYAVGDALVATLVSFTVGFLALSAILVVEAPALTWPGEMWLYLGGGIAAAYVMTATSTVGRLGALRLSLATIGGQLTMASVLDVIAPVEGQQLTVFKVVGAVLAFGAVALASGIQRPHRNR